MSDPDACYVLILPPARAGTPISNGRCQYSVPSTKLCGPDEWQANGTSSPIERHN
jgi:hypothetical protein